jgi:hypothetical protein
MQLRSFASVLPKHIWALLAVYFVASLAHFAHNAEYIAYYPNMPVWLTREKVYLAWLGVTSLGVAGLVVARMRLQALGALLIAAYGALGLDGLAHYTLALCSEHTLLTNLTIWAEASAGLVLLLASALHLCQRVRQSKRNTSQN